MRISDPHIEASGADAYSGLNLIMALESYVLFLPDVTLLGRMNAWNSVSIKNNSKTEGSPPPSSNLKHLEF